MQRSRRLGLLYSRRLPALDGIHMTIQNGVGEYIALGLNSTKTLKLQDQYFPPYKASLSEANGTACSCCPAGQSHGQGTRSADREASPSAVSGAIVEPR